MRRDKSLAELAAMPRFHVDAFTLDGRISPQLPRARPCRSAASFERHTMSRPRVGHFIVRQPAWLACRKPPAPIDVIEHSRRLRRLLLTMRYAGLPATLLLLLYKLSRHC